MGKDGEKQMLNKAYRQRITHECSSIHSANSGKNCENSSLELLLDSENVDPKIQSAHASPQLGGKSFSVMEQLMP